MRLDRSGLIPYLLLIVTVLLVWGFVQTRSEDVAQHNRRSYLILELEHLEGELDKLVLSTAAFRLQQYDGFVTTVHALRRIGAALEARALPRRGPESRSFDALMSQHRAALDEKLTLAERIKSRAALLRNGLHYLPLAVGELQAEDHLLGERLARLLNDLYRYNLFPGLLEARDIEARLDELALFHEAMPRLWERLNNIQLHMRANLALIGQLWDLREAYVGVPAKRYLQELYQWQKVEYSADSRHTERVSWLLLSLTVGLLAGLGFTLRRLARTRHRAERAWAQLRDAVESLSEAFALFAPDGRLVLHNNRYTDFYPWLRGRLAAGVTRLQIQHWNRQAELVVESGAGGELAERTLAGDREAPGHFVEKTPDNRWYQAGDSRTSAGELVCVRVDISESKRTEQELRKLYRALEQSPATVLITDTAGNIEYANPKFEQTTGYRTDEVMGQNPRILKSGDKSLEEYQELWSTITGGQVWRGQFHNKRKDGEIYWESASISPVRDEHGEITHFIAVKEDITARKRAEDQLRLNATVFETTTEGIIVSDAQNRIKTVNPAFTRITGYEPEEVVGRNPAILGSGRHDGQFYAEMWDTLSNTGYWNGEIWNRRKDGSVYPEWLSLAAIRDAKGEIQEYVAVFSDITRRKQNEEQIRRQANYDALTGLPNRALLSDRLARSLSAANRGAHQVALLFVDLDRFKVVNDTLGHVMGDQLLQQVAECLRQCVRDIDTVARFGGDEFVIVLDRLRLANDAAGVAKKVLEALEQDFDLAGRPINIGASIGISLYPDDAQDADSMLRNADMSMYRAKEAGRNTYQFFTPGMNEQVRRRLELERDLRLAQDRDQLILYYQPIIGADSETVVGAEALLRWRHPQLGLVMPGQFIGLAEETGYIEPIGRWVLGEACRQLAVWRAAGLDLCINVNLSSRQLSNGLDVEVLLRMLDEAALPATAMTLEITESLLLEGSESTLQWMREVRAAGMQLAIDDFGTGYSSLSYLKRFPMSILKIDRAFVKDLPDDAEDASLVQAIMAIARSLNLKVAAEGVECEQQLAFLRQQGCDSYQGYLFSRPLPAAAFADLVRRLPHGSAGPARRDKVSIG